MKFSRLTSIFILLLMISITACGHDHSHDDDHEHDEDEFFRITHWVNEVEFFALFEIHEGSGRIEGKLFISKNNRPVEEISGILSFRENGENVAEQELSTRRPGIFPFELFFQHSDEPDLVLHANLEGEEFDLILGNVYRYADHPVETDVANLVSLDKQMQWRVSVASVFAEYHEIPEIISGLGRILPNPSNYYKVTSPVDGHIDADFFPIIPVSGAIVNEGDRLVAISPPFASGNSWVELQMAFLQAEEAYNRARRLLENDAISLREYQLREREYEVRKAGYDHFLSGNNHGAHIEDAGQLLYLNAYHSGVIAESYVMSGMPVTQSDLLFTIYDPGNLWLEVLGYRNELRDLTDITGAELLINRNERLTLEPEEVSLVSRDLRSDQSGSRSKIILSVENRDQLLALHQPVRVRLKGAESDRVVAVPNEALFDDDSHKVVFVAHSGDQFERRVVQTGSSYGGLTAILEGVQAGEKIVTQGTYPLHLLTGNIEIDDGHHH